MVEAQAEFLCTIASTLSNDDDTQALLKSYLFMRCKDISRGFGLPDKHFSTIIRCPHCCSEWRSGTDSQIKTFKLSKSRRKKLKQNNKNEELNNLLHSNQLESTCTLCKHTTVTPLLKPSRKKHFKISPNNIIDDSLKATESGTNKICIKSNKNKKLKRLTINAYSVAKDIFSLTNDNNSLPKEQPKIIRNNKKKKDKFAGLCQQAVLSAAKEKKDKLSIFLKPSL